MDQRQIQDIVLSAKNGSQQAYRSLVAEFGSSLLGYFYRNTGKIDDAEDLVQEVFVRVVKGLKRYSEQEKFHIWLFRIAHNLLIDYWRKHKMKLESEISNEEQNSFSQNIASDEIDPVLVLSNRERYDELQQALEKLPANQKEVLLMRYFSGLSFDEISQINGTPIGTSLARAHRGLDKLKSILQKGKDIDNEAE